MAKPDKNKDKKEKPLLLTGNLPKGAEDIKAYLNKQFAIDGKESNVAAIGTDVDGDMSNVVIHSTGILGLDRYLGIGGIAGGRILDFYGWEGTGKTLTALMIGAHFQRIGKRFAFLDAEATFSPNMAKSVGVDLEELILVRSTPDKILTGEDYFEAARTLIQLGVEFIAIDSVPALVPSIVMQKRIGEGQKASPAQMMAEGLQQMIPILGGLKQSVVYFINQMRGVPMVMFGPSEKETGGNALRFYASIRMEVQKLTDIKAKVRMPDGRVVETQLGVRNKYILDKNKTAIVPILPLELDVYFQPKWGDKWILEDGTEIQPGIDIYKDMADVGIKSGVVIQSGAWYNFEDVRGQGFDAFVAGIKANPVAQMLLRERVMSAGTMPIPPSTEIEKPAKIKKTS